MKDEIIRRMADELEDLFLIDFHKDYNYDRLHTAVERILDDYSVG